MKALRRRLEQLERARRADASLELTAEERAALASDVPWSALAMSALMKEVARYGLEHLILRSYEQAPAR